jgi:hypothetical protein
MGGTAPGVMVIVTGALNPFCAVSMNVTVIEFDLAVPAVAGFV